VANAGKAVAELPFELTLAGIEMPVAVRVVDHVVEILQPLFADEITQNVHVAI
jgi:hypothetical protein